MVGDRRPVVLDLVARRRQVGADAVGGLAPALARERLGAGGPAPSRSRPVKYFEYSPGTGALARRGRSDASTAPDGSVWATQEAPEPAQHVVVARRRRWPRGESTSPATRSAVAPVSTCPCQSTAAQPSRSTSRSSAHSVPRSAERERPRQSRPRRPGRGPSPPRRGGPRCTRAAPSRRRRRRGTARCRRAPGCGRTSRRSACAERRSSPAVDRRAALRRRHAPRTTRRDAQSAARPRQATRRRQTRRSAADRHGRPAAAVAAPADARGRSSAGSANQAVSGRRLSAQRGGRRARGPWCRRGPRPRAGSRAGRLDAEAGQPVEPRAPPRAKRRWPSGRRVDAEHPIAGRRHRPDHEHGDAEVREDLDRRRRPRSRRGRRRRPTRPRSGCARHHSPTAMNSSVSTITLAAPVWKRPVGQQRDRPVRQRRRLQLVAGPHDPLPGDGAAEPVGIDELAQPGRPVDRGALEPQQPQRPGRAP